MQHIDGAPLSEHFSSLREKGLSFSEERIWKIFVQVTTTTTTSQLCLNDLLFKLRNCPFSATALKKEYRL